jgi:hypothetical protein
MIEAALGWAPYMRLLDGIVRSRRWIRGDHHENAR